MTDLSAAPPLPKPVTPAKAATPPPAAPSPAPRPQAAAPAPRPQAPAAKAAVAPEPGKPLTQAQIRDKMIAEAISRRDESLALSRLRQSQGDPSIFNGRG